MNVTEQDIALLKGLAVQDKDSIEQIYKTYYPMVENLIINNQGDPDDVADIFQEAMLVIYEKSLDESFILTSQLKTYLYSVSKRLWLKKLNKNKRFIKQSDDLESVISVDDEIEKLQTQQRHFEIMELALQKIGEPCKSLLEAYYFGKKQMHEIAQEFNYTNADNAKTQKYKCLVRLKKLFFAAYKNL